MHYTNAYTLYYLFLKMSYVSVFVKNCTLRFCLQRSWSRTQES